MNFPTKITKLALPEISTTSLEHLDQLIAAINVPRTVLASREAITYSWENLPRLLQEIPAHQRNELVAKMCIAIHTGLFDSAINYIWNAAILALRDKVHLFGLPIIASIKSNDFEEKHLLELKDSELLSLVLELNIIDEQAYFFLDQARATRNSYSVAHPTLQMIDEYELINFANRCIKNALANPINHTGLVIQDFISQLNQDKFKDQQFDYWLNCIENTYDTQKSSIISMMHNMYCDANKSESTRQNILKLCEKLKNSFSNLTKKNLLDSHTDYLSKGKDDKYKASLKFFENLNLIDLLSNTEKYNLFSRAIDRLYQVHNGFDNFYNEPPFAERLNELADQNAIPPALQENFVEVIACCFIGNGYGVSNGAIKHYAKMIGNFSPIEISHLLNLAKHDKNNLGYRIRNTSNCRARFKELLTLINIQIIPASVKPIYDFLMK